MPAQIRIPYYRLDFAGFFALQKVWKLVDKTEGCKPLKNPQAAILMERKPRRCPARSRLSRRKQRSRSLIQKPLRKSKRQRKLPPRQRLLPEL